MDIVSLLLIAVALSMDAFAVAVTGGIVESRVTAGKVGKMAFFFGFFQFLMPVLGYALGKSVSRYITAFDHWVAFALLTFIGARMIWEALRGAPEGEAAIDPFCTKTLLLMAVATSIDALAVGVSFALTNANIWFSSVTIGVVTFILSALGVLLGKKVGALFQKRAQILGGVILIGIGVKILLEHMLG